MVAFLLWYGNGIARKTDAVYGLGANHGICLGKQSGFVVRLVS
jgi:hypothetical protein